MNNSQPTILVLGIGRTLPTFIKRRLLALDKEGLRLILPVKNTKGTGGFINAQVVKIPTIEKSNPVYVFWQLVLFLLRFPANLKVWQALEGQPFYSRLKISLTAVKLVDFPKVDLIHLQWLVPEERYLWLKTFYPGVPILLSIRGSQVTVNPKINPLYKNFVALNFQYANAIHCVSRDLTEHCKALGAPPEKLFVNYNGIDLKSFKPIKTKKNHEGIKIVSVGALVWRKGYVFQLQIISELIKRGVDVTLYIVGSGEELKGLMYMAHRLGVEHAISFEGQQSEDFIKQFLPSMDIYLATSAAEGLPNSLVEAASCGLPIVTFDCEGAREIVEEGKNGCIIPYGAVQLAADKIVLFSDRNNLEQAGRYAREKVENEFDQQFWVKQMVDHFQVIITKSK